MSTFWRTDLGQIWDQFLTSLNPAQANISIGLNSLETQFKNENPNKEIIQKSLKLIRQGLQAHSSAMDKTYNKLKKQGGFE